MSKNLHDGGASRRLLRLPEVMRIVGLGRSSLYDRIQHGRFPSPVSLGGRAVAWRSQDIEDWIETRMSTRRKGLMK
jgi:prophage regulatory protein